MTVDYQKHADGPALVIRAETISEGIDLGLLMSALWKDGIPHKKWGTEGIRIELTSRKVEL
jgi:hypothetical protein